MTLPNPMTPAMRDARAKIESLEDEVDRLNEAAADATKALIIGIAEMRDARRVLEETRAAIAWYVDHIGAHEGIDFLKGFGVDDNVHAILIRKLAGGPNAQA